MPTPSYLPLSPYTVSTLIQDQIFFLIYHPKNGVTLKSCTNLNTLFEGIVLKIEHCAGKFTCIYVTMQLSNCLTTVNHWCNN